MGLGKGLGRGFESLIPTELVDDEFDLTAEEDKKESELKELKIADIVRDEDQPRREFDKEAIKALANSIREHGVLQPIVVTKEGAKYKIVAGERRWRASKEAGKTTIPAIVRSLDSQKRLELSIIENAQREDLNPLGLATAYVKLKAQFNMTTKEIAEKIGKSEVAIATTMRLLNLPEDVKKVAVQEKLSESVMKPLIAADEEMVKKVLPKIVSEGWTARKVERYFSDNKKKSSAGAIKQRMNHRDEDALAAKYGAIVRIAGKGLSFSCKSEKDLKELVAKLLK